MTHTIYVGASSNWHLIAWCTCSPNDPLPFASREVISLAELSEIAHEHIEASEKAPSAEHLVGQYRVPNELRGAVAANLAGRGYRVESALTSEDQLIDLDVPIGPGHASG